MSRILVNCPSSDLPVATGRHAPGVDLATLVGEHAFRCDCGAVHLWDADGAWVEDGRSLARETLAAMVHLQAYLRGPPMDALSPADDLTMGGRGTRLWRECLLTP